MIKGWAVIIALGLTWFVIEVFTTLFWWTSFSDSLRTTFGVYLIGVIDVIGTIELFNTVIAGLTVEFIVVLIGGVVVSLIIVLLIKPFYMLLLLLILEFTLTGGISIGIVVFFA